LNGIPHPLESSALARPQHLALVAGDVSLTMRALANKVSQRASVLTAQGIKAGDVVPLGGVANAEWVINFFAIGWLNAIAAPKCSETTLLSHVNNFTYPPTPEPFWPLDAVRLHMQTSGSEGVPKTIAITTLQLLLSAFGSAIRLEHRLDDAWLCCLPLHHMGGLSVLLRCAFYGTTVVLHEHYSAEQVQQALNSGEISMVSLVPTMLHDVLQLQGTKPFHARLRLILLGGAKASETLLQRCRHLPISQSWGMTEAASQICTSFPGDLASCGAPLAFARVDTVEGALRVRGPLVCNNELQTRDRGQVDAAGAVRVFGRQDDIIICGGENFDPVQLENTLLQFTAISEACVVGVADERLGHRPVAALVARHQPISLPTPLRHVWLDALPKLSNGKYDKCSLARLLRNIVEPGLQVFRYGDLLQRIHVDADVRQTDLSAQCVVDPEDLIVNNHRMRADLVDDQLNTQDITQSSGLVELGLGVHDGQSDTLLQQRFHAAQGTAEHFLKSHVTVLEEAAEKNNTSSVDFKKTYGDLMLKRHGDPIPAMLKEVNHGK
jgi:o-succinylbenzoate---CoA ligase